MEKGNIVMYQDINNMFIKLENLITDKLKNYDTECFKDIYSQFQKFIYYFSFYHKYIYLKVIKN